MARIVSTFLIAILSILPGAARAQWALEQGGGAALAQIGSGSHLFSLSCENGRGEQLYFSIRHLGGGDADLAAARGAMLWIALPDGRTHRQPVDLEGTARGTGGIFHTSDFVLDFFRNAQTMEVQLLPEARTLAVLGMRGSGAARLAFLEQCGI